MMSLDKMDSAAGKVRRCQALIAMLELAGPQASIEQIMEVVGVLKDGLAEASADIEESFELRQHRPAQPVSTMACSAGVTCLLPNRRIAQTPGA